MRKPKVRSAEPTSGINGEQTVVASRKLWLKLRLATLLAVTACAAWMIAEAQESGEKVAPPIAARQSEIRKLLDETLELPKATTATKKQQAVQKLTEMAADPNTSSEELYVVLTTAMTLLRETGDFPIYLKLVDQLVETYRFDADSERTRYLTEFMASCKSMATLEPAVAEVIASVDDAARDSRYRPANELLDAADKHAKRLNATKLAKSLAEARQSLRGRELAYQAMTQAQKTLEQKPDDPKANTAVGIWFAVYESDWEQARPKLISGSDAKWKAAAAAEPSSADDIDRQLVAADAWWDVALSATGDAKLAAQRRAQYWYSTYEPSVKSPLVKARVVKRLEEISAIVDPKSASPAIVVKGSTRPSKSEEVSIPVGKPVDLLKAFKLADHGLRGKLVRDGNSVVSNTSRGGFMLPIVAKGSYELVIEFTPIEANPFKCVFPVGTSSCGIVVGAHGGSVSGLEAVDGCAVAEGSVASGAIVRPGKLVAAVRHQLRITVNQTDDSATIEGKLDDSLVTSWKGRVAQLGPFCEHMIPCAHAIGIHNYGRVEVHAIEFRLNKGGKAHLLGADWKNSITQAAATPPKEIASSCVIWKGRSYYFGDKPVYFVDAQQLAVRLQGRLLTISSAEEEQFVKANGRGQDYWLSAWRPLSSKDWRDDRNRPLRYFGTWGPNQPELYDGHGNLVYSPTGWHDDPSTSLVRACIEWGEEDLSKK